MLKLRSFQPQDRVVTCSKFSELQKTGAAVNFKDLDRGLLCTFFWFKIYIQSGGMICFIFRPAKELRSLPWLQMLPQGVWSITV